MAWRISTGMESALLAGNPIVKTKLAASTISMGDGDGTGGRDTINDSGAGLASFTKHGFIMIVSGDANDGVIVKALDITTGTIEVPTGTLVSVSSGSIITLIELDSSGSLAGLLANSVIDIYSGVRPANADAIEGAGTHLLRITLNGDPFVAGSATNGLNLGDISGSILKRMTDPDTLVKEIWRGAGLSDGTAGWARWYANDLTTGASTIAIRMDGVVSTSGAEVNMVNGTTVATAVNSEVSDVSFTLTSV